MLVIEHVAKAYGAHAVLNDISFTLGPGERAGLVGANGVGKSTLLKLIVGEVEPDRGRVAVQAASVGYLPQLVSAGGGRTVEALIREAQGELVELERRLRALERELTTASDDELTRRLAEYGEVAERFEQRGGYDLEHRAGRVLTGLGLGDLDLGRPLDTLSGGEKARVGLAALLLKGPDLLLLDEPTNHLDFAALTWLEEYLHIHAGAALIVSHDRQFLNATAGQIVEIDEHTHESRVYAGNYDRYAAEKARERARWVADYAAQQAEIKELRAAQQGPAQQVGHNRPARDRDKTQHHFFGERVQQAVSRNVRAVEERLRRIEASRVPRPPEPIHINPDLAPAELGARVPLSAHGLTRRYRDRTLFERVDIAVYPDSRVVVAGPNGAGKSSLLRLLARREAPDAGTVAVSPTVRLGYLDQEQATLDPTLTLFEAYRAGLTGAEVDLRNDLMRYGLVAYGDLDKRVGDLSVGQQRKLQLARLIAGRANLLLLDEPTNHVSFDVLEAFEQALIEFPGPVVAVSHDRRFIARFAREVWELRDGRLLQRLDGPAGYLAVNPE